MRLEHANLSVLDAEAMTRFLQAVAPSFRVRGEGVDAQGRPWRHVGNDDFYIALQTVPSSDTRTPYGNTPGLNHLGWEVESLAAIEVRMAAAGYAPNLRINDHPARRWLYYYDPEGNDWEFVEYVTDDPRLRHDYGDAR